MRFILNKHSGAKISNLKYSITIPFNTLNNLFNNNTLNNLFNK